jgi:hypothetical protein
MVRYGWGNGHDNMSCGKNVDNFMLKNLTLTKCQGTRWNGDNPLVHIQTPTYIIYSPTFSHHFLYGYSVMTIFFPLTLSGRPLFYYICFPDKKGMPSGIGGGTSLRVLYDHFYPLQGGNRYTY